MYEFCIYKSKHLVFSYYRTIILTKYDKKSILEKFKGGILMYKEDTSRFAKIFKDPLYDYV